MLRSRPRRKSALSLRQRFPAFALTLATSTLFCLPAPPAAAQVKDWINPGVNQPWTGAGSWFPFGLPGGADIARIGNVPIAHNSNVVLTNNQSVGGLLIANDASLYINNGGGLNVGNNVIVTDAGSELLIQRGGLALTADNINVNDGAELRLGNGGEIVVNDSMYTQFGATISGRGVIELLGNIGNVFQNNGHIESSAGYGGLVINQAGDALVDLDGHLGSGSITVDKGNSFFGQDKFTVNGTELFDDFNGTINMATASILDMNLSNGWRAAPGSVINVQYSLANSNGNAIIEGGHLSMAGEMNLLTDMNGGGDLVRILADTTVEPNAVTTIESNNTLRFEGETMLQGGSFSTPSNLSSEGSIIFAGETEYEGIVNVNGIARQVGDADVTNFSTINAGVIDMDGNGSTEWSVGSSFTVNAASIDSTISNSFDGTVNVGSGFLGTMTINLDGTLFDEWTMAGEMNLSTTNIIPFSINRLAGSPMRLTGELNIEHRVGISAPTKFDSQSITNLPDADTILSLHGMSTIRAGATFNGIGTINNTSDEGLRLKDGVDLDEVGLVNAGLLQIGNSPGSASVDRFENTDEGTWNVEIGGHIAALEHDLLIVTDGETLLDGLIDVDLIDAGGGLFLPEIGDEFTVLTSVVEIMGEFVNDPVTFAAGHTYHWDVLHHPHDVTLRLVDITVGVPEPTAISLAAIGVVAFATRRRRR